MVNDAIVTKFDITLICAGKARLICQLFAKYRSADLSVSSWSLRNLAC